MISRILRALRAGVLSLAAGRAVRAARILMSMSR